MTIPTIGVPQKRVVAIPSGKAKCASCGDFGTIVFNGCERGSVMAEIMESEAPCTCPAGDLWRALFAEWDRPVTIKGSKWPAAVVIDPEPRRPEPVQAPQSVKLEASRMLAGVGGRG